MFSTAFEHETKKGQLVHPSVSERAERCSFDPSPCPDFLSGFDADHLPVSSIASRLGTKVQQRLDNGPQTAARCSCRFALSLRLWSLCKQVRRKQPACCLAKIKHLERKVMSEESRGLQRKHWAGMHTPYIHVPHQQPPSKAFISLCHSIPSADPVPQRCFHHHSVDCDLVRQGNYAKGLRLVVGVLALRGNPSALWSLGGARAGSSCHQDG